MALGKLWVIAYRDLGRNRRRSILSLMAVALGLAILIAMNGIVVGTMDMSIRNGILLDTGHVQIRAESYEIEKLSLLWQDLLDDTTTLAANAEKLEQVESATPVLWASGILSTIHDSVGLKVYGINPSADFHKPIKDGLVAGQFITADDRDGILIGEKLADSLGIGVGQKVSLTIASSEGAPDEGIFTVKGLFSSGVPGYDESTVFMPLSKAQAFTKAGERASTIIIMLHDKQDADEVAASLRSPGMQTLTWLDMNSIILDTIEQSQSLYVMMYGIVMLIVGVIIANTLLMAVFERIREMGIMAALGMKRRQIMLMFLMEAATLAFTGIVIGILIGAIFVAYLASVGIHIGDVSSVASNVYYGTSLTAKFSFSEVTSLSFWTLLITLLASLYPAWFASRLEPVEALHTL